VREAEIELLIISSETRLKIHSHGTYLRERDVIEKALWTKNVMEKLFASTFYDRLNNFFAT